MNKEHYLKQYNEVADIVKGKTIEQIRDIFGNGVTNDFVEGDERIIDANYKDILVTVVERNGAVEMTRNFEMYSSEGVYLGLEYAY